ncbi:MAG: hypothetical protein QOI55_605 [Actinomycetota bacterium]|jgi:hypothetical protein|nr:hypothetical protein [Actinomycetota bacterium]
MSAIDRLPEHLKSRRTGEAIMAPSAIVAAGAGASIGILAGAPVAAILGIGVLAYALVVGVKLPRTPRGAREERIDPRTLSEPWSRFVSEALQARRHFDDVVRSVSSGPIRDRLAEIGTRIGAAVHECWRIARRGDALVAGLRSLDLDDVKRQLDAVHEEQRRPGSNAPALDKTCAALEAQLASGERLQRVATDARDRLQLLDARLDEAVARAVELSLQAGDVQDLSGLGDDVDSLLGDLESLRQGLDEAGKASTLGAP